MLKKKSSSKSKNASHYPLRMAAAIPWRGGFKQQQGIRYANHFVVFSF